MPCKMQFAGREDFTQMLKLFLDTDLMKVSTSTAEIWKRVLRETRFSSRHKVGGEASWGASSGPG